MNAEWQCPAIDLNTRVARLAPEHLRIATFNAYLNRRAEGGLIADLQNPADQLSDADNSDRQINAVAEIIQRVRPDILLLNEFDYDTQGTGIDLFQQHYLGVSQNGQSPIRYPYYFVTTVNTGVASEFDLNNDGRVGGPDDAYGFGEFAGQYGMVVLSMFPIEHTAVRTFQKFLWKDMPGAMLPDNPATPDPHDWYSVDELNQVRLSSKSHWDIPVRINHHLVHILAAHPTPPGFDGPENRNGHRNHDEIRLWADYISGGDAASYMYDDNGKAGGLNSTDLFVILGDYNADPGDGDSVKHSIRQLLQHTRIIANPAPASIGGERDALTAQGVNSTHKGNPALDTADFNPKGPGNLRVDYVLPSIGMSVVCGGVFWPVPEDALYSLTGSGYPVVSSDHRLVWLDLELPLQ